MNLYEVQCSDALTGERLGPARIRACSEVDACERLRLMGLAPIEIGPADEAGAPAPETLAEVRAAAARAESAAIKERTVTVLESSPRIVTESRGECAGVTDRLLRWLRRER